MQVFSNETCEYLTIGREEKKTLEYINMVSVRKTRKACANPSSKENLYLPLHKEKGSNKINLKASITTSTYAIAS